MYKFLTSKLFSSSLGESQSSTLTFKRYKGKRRNPRPRNVLKVTQDSLVGFIDPEREHGGAWPVVLKHGFPAAPPYPPCEDPKLRVYSDTFLQYNDAEGHRHSVSLDNYHWRTGNTLNLESIKEFDGHIRRLDFSFYPYQVAFVKNQYYPDFCPGVNLADVHQHGKEYNVEVLNASYQLLYSIATCKNLIVLAPSGVTAGLGASMTFFAPLRGSTETTDVSFPQVSYGYFPDCGASWFLPKLNGSVGMYLALTAKHLHNSDVYWSGFSCAMFENEFMNRVDDVMSHYSRKGGNINQSARAVQTVSLGPNVSTIGQYMEAIDRCFGEQHTTLQSVFDALEREGTDWSRRILKRLESYSPISLHVTFRLQKMGKYMKTIEECFQTEYQVARHFLNSPDYWEGIKATVVEQREPNWSYKSIYDVPEDEIAQYFERATDDVLHLTPSHFGSTYNTDIRWYEKTVNEATKELLIEAEPESGYNLDEVIGDLKSLEDKSLGEILNKYKKMIYEKDLHKLSAGFTGFNYAVQKDPFMLPDSSMTKYDREMLLAISRDGYEPNLGTPSKPVETKRDEIQEALDELRKPSSEFNLINPNFSIYDCPYERNAKKITPASHFYENASGFTRVQVEDFDKAIEAMVHLVGHEDRSPKYFVPDQQAGGKDYIIEEQSKDPESLEPWDVVLFDQFSDPADERLEQEQTGVEAET